MQIKTSIPLSLEAFYNYSLIPDAAADTDLKMMEHPKVN